MGIFPSSACEADWLPSPSIADQLKAYLIAATFSVAMRTNSLGKPRATGRELFPNPRCRVPTKFVALLKHGKRTPAS